MRIAFAIILFAVAGCSGNGVQNCDFNCDANARCVLDNGVAACVCNPGYDGNGQTCADVDECATSNGGCDANATCSNIDGYRLCTCNFGYEGDGESCAPFYNEARAACAVREAEHPGYTNIARDVALCGSQYTPANISTACATGWHVCLEQEWLARYPTDRPYGMTDPDPTLATLGAFTTWGAPQAFRCVGGVWLTNAPTDIVTPYDSPVCYYPGDTYSNADGADYLPYNNGKFLFANDGTTIMEGLNYLGDPDCCSWDVTWQATAQVDGFAVYCCLD